MTSVDVNKYAQVRVLNVIPFTGSSDTLLFKSANSANYVNSSSVLTSLGSYYPLSSPKYFTQLFGQDSISLHFVAKTTVPKVSAFTYKSSMTLTKGRWSAFISNASQNPILLADLDNVPATNAWADTVCFVRVANFFYKADGVTPYGPLTLMAKHNVTGAAWETVASNIAFGTISPAYYLYRLKNTANTKPWGGAESNITFALFDVNGVQYQQFSSATTSVKAAYSNATISLGKGRAYVFYVNGKEGTTNNTDQRISLSQYSPL
jgi:hypothetical protein